MLHLRPENLLVQKTLTEAWNASKAGSPLTLDRVISDFDYTTLHVSNSPDDKSILWLSIRTKAWQSVVKCGGDFAGYLKSKYNGFHAVSECSPEQGYDFTVQVKLDELDADAIVQLSLMKIHIMSYPFQLAFDEFARLSQLPEGSNASDTVHQIQYRDDENIFIKPSSDRITVIFETFFQDETDKVFGKVFLQEFVDARKRNRNIQSAPQVLFSHEPPLEAASLMAARSADKNRRFITFVLFPRHFQTPELQFSSVCHLSLFRNYFHYHIKCSKAYMHSRMRYRVDTFIKVLNRAKVDDEEEAGEQTTRRTITGRKLVY
ncbi:Arc35p [Lachancea thermotolerans CBS 6340]|uniref:Arp2/3 complex 34 kDa subunit n=1 Tax=Lachancea thermotolerans (strain ATCC 56472 / CBS 6340 / NRRL Y-8284) TaxID=559295 RepID=C5DC13_LACTC|nr:KLTH0A06996p [Lachancea thermotolerans CBS 6340]CAR21320.1 KLTH0A06996p [Lachancea thermotolerans CBS 6340]